MAGGYFVFFRTSEQSAPAYQREQVASASRSTGLTTEKNTLGASLKNLEMETKKEDVREAGKENEKNTITLTDAIAQTFVSELTASKQAGGQITKNEINELAETVFGVLQNYSAETKKYSLENLKITDDDTEQSIKTYANKLAEILKKEFDPIPEDETGIFNAALSQEDSKRLEDLKIISVAYKNVSISALGLEVPRKLMHSHLSIINEFDLIAGNIAGMQAVLSDPAVGYLGFQNYSKNIMTAYGALNNINKYLAENKITFGAEEPANLFALYADLKKTP